MIILAFLQRSGGTSWSSLKIPGVRVLRARERFFTSRNLLITTCTERRFEAPEVNRKKMLTY